MSEQLFLEAFNSEPYFFEKEEKYGAMDIIYTFEDESGHGFKFHFEKKVALGKHAYVCVLSQRTPGLKTYKRVIGKFSNPMRTVATLLAVVRDIHATRKDVHGIVMSIPEQAFGSYSRLVKKIMTRELRTVLNVEDGDYTPEDFEKMGLVGIVTTVKPRNMNTVYTGPALKEYQERQAGKDGAGISTPTAVVPGAKVSNVILSAKASINKTGAKIVFEAGSLVQGFDNSDLKAAAQNIASKYQSVTPFVETSGVGFTSKNVLDALKAANELSSVAEGNGYQIKVTAEGALSSIGFKLSELKVKFSLTGLDASNAKLTYTENGESVKLLALSLGWSAIGGNGSYSLMSYNGDIEQLRSSLKEYGTEEKAPAVVKKPDFAAPANLPKQTSVISKESTLEIETRYDGVFQSGNAFRVTVHGVEENGGKGVINIFKKNGFSYLSDSLNRLIFSYPGESAPNIDSDLARVVNEINASTNFEAIIGKRYVGINHAFKYEGRAYAMFSSPRELKVAHAIVLSAGIKGLELYNEPGKYHLIDSSGKMSSKEFSDLLTPLFGEGRIISDRPAVDSVAEKEAFYFDYDHRQITLTFDNAEIAGRIKDQLLELGAAIFNDNEFFTDKEKLILLDDKSLDVKKVQATLFPILGQPVSMNGVFVDPNVTTSVRSPDGVTYKIKGNTIQVEDAPKDSAMSIARVLIPMADRIFDDKGSNTLELNEQGIADGFTIHNIAPTFKKSNISTRLSAKLFRSWESAVTEASNKYELSTGDLGSSFTNNSSYLIDAATSGVVGEYTRTAGNVISGIVLKSNYKIREAVAKPLVALGFAVEYDVQGWRTQVKLPVNSDYTIPGTSELAVFIKEVDNLANIARNRQIVEYVGGNKNFKARWNPDGSRAFLILPTAESSGLGWRDYTAYATAPEYVRVDNIGSYEEFLKLAEFAKNFDFGANLLRNIGVSKYLSDVRSGGAKASKSYKLKDGGEVEISFKFGDKVTFIFNQNSEGFDKEMSEFVSEKMEISGRASAIPLYMLGTADANKTLKNIDAWLDAHIVSKEDNASKGNGEASAVAAPKPKLKLFNDLTIKLKRRGNLPQVTINVKGDDVFLTQIGPSGMSAVEARNLAFLMNSNPAYGSIDSKNAEVKRRLLQLVGATKSRIESEISSWTNGLQQVESIIGNIGTEASKVDIPPTAPKSKNIVKPPKIERKKVNDSQYNVLIDGVIEGRISKTTSKGKATWAIYHDKSGIQIYGYLLASTLFEDFKKQYLQWFEAQSSKEDTFQATLNGHDSEDDDLYGLDDDISVAITGSESVLANMKAKLTPVIAKHNIEELNVINGGKTLVAFFDKYSSNSTAKRFIDFLNNEFKGSQAKAPTEAKTSGIVKANAEAKTDLVQRYPSIPTELAKAPKYESKRKNFNIAGAFDVEYKFKDILITETSKGVLDLIRKGLKKADISFDEVNSGKISFKNVDRNRNTHTLWVNQNISSANNGSGVGTSLSNYVFKPGINGSEAKSEEMQTTLRDGYNAMAKPTEFLKYINDLGHGVYIWTLDKDERVPAIRLPGGFWGYFLKLFSTQELNEGIKEDLTGKAPNRVTKKALTEAMRGFNSAQFTYGGAILNCVIKECAVEIFPSRGNVTNFAKMLGARLGQELRIDDEGFLSFDLDNI